MNKHLMRALESSIAHLNAAGGVQYTRRQLYYTVCRTLRPLPGWPTALGLSAAPLALLALPTLSAPQRRAMVASAAALGAAGPTLARLVPSTRPLPLTYVDFLDVLRTYCERCGEPPGLLPPAEPLELTPPGREPDLLDYGLDRLLVCQDADIARMLLANRLHMEAKCAVVALADGVPPAIATMLERTPGARVSLLHDASCAGLRLAAALHEQFDLPETIQTAAIGLRPTHAQRLHLFAKHTPAAETSDDVLPSYLTPGERRWLRAGWSAEVAALHPVRLLVKTRRILTDNVVSRWQLYNPRRDRTTGFMTWPTT